MAYIGNQQTQGFSSIPAKQDFTNITGTSLTLTHAVASAEGIDLFINNVRQEPTTAYSIGSDGVTVTLTGPVTATDDIYVVYNSLALQTTVTPDASVSTAKIIDGSVTSAKLDTNIDIAGTLDSTGIITADAGIKLGTGTDILNSFEEGTWTPTNTAGITLTVSANRYQRVGNLVFINAFINFPSSSAASGVVLGGVPYAPAGSFSVGAFNNTSQMLYAYFDANGISIRNSANNTRSFAEVSGGFVAFQITYYTTA
tara:strand:+ start:2912 stop:3679 length:768 start_codon:yes stop_codon:yes gene_type:complete